MGYFSDAWSSIASAFGSSDSDSQSPASISSATGELTDAGKAMGGQEAVDANMAAGADSESAWGNFFHGITGQNVTGGDTGTMDAITKNQKEQKERDAQRDREFQEFANSRDGGSSFLPRIQSGDVQKEDPMLQSQIKPARVAGGPFTGALNNIQPQFIS